jgi:dTDP-4-dehydrorhamnose reductase
LKILVTGGNGQLGNELKVLSKDFSDYNFIFTDLPELDLNDRKATDDFIGTIQPRILINCAAYTAVDKAETEKESAQKVNCNVVKSLAETCRSKGIFMIHGSTDYVFDGQGNSPYTENEPTNPQSVYGKTKLDGETAMMNSKVNGIIIRTSWLYSTFGGNFVKTMIRLQKEKGEINVVADQIGSPTYARDLARAILHILPQIDTCKGTDIFHFANSDVTSWYDFAKEIFNISKLNCIVNPISTAEYPTPAKRPQYSVLKTDKIRERFGVEIPAWQDSLRECIQRMKENGKL